jgi:uncharacterized protein (TIGR01319 family)
MLIIYLRILRLLVAVSLVVACLTVQGIGAVTPKLIRNTGSRRGLGGRILDVILATDVGSTTTKAILLERHATGWRLAAREEAPTTVEAPYEDVTVGVRQAVARLERVSGRRLLADGEVVAPRQGDVGADLYISTSSAGGGLQMVAAGLIRTYSSASAERAALGAGAIVSRTMTITDARLAAEAVDLIRRLRPDIVLLCGGTDQGNLPGVLTLAEYIAVADPRPRVGGGRLPVIYAGNPAARDEVRRLLGDRFDVSAVENVRPDIEEERLEPARNEVHRVFLEHVMSRAPGYDRLLRWAARRLEPTPSAVGTMIRMFAAASGRDLLGIDIGGATTDVFTVIGGAFTRSVSANLGLSYSAGNVLQHAGIERILRWLPFEAAPDEVLDSIYNKMIRPTTLPETVEELMLEHALAREAISLAVAHHQEFMPAGTRPQRDAWRSIFSRQAGTTGTPGLRPGMIIGSGGPLCHAPRRTQASLIMLDAASPAGVVELFVDSVFMLPHLGVLATSDPSIATEVFERDCLVRLGTAFVADLPRWIRPGQVVGQARVINSDPDTSSPRQPVELTLRAGEIVRVPVQLGSQATVEIYPRGRVDFGRGPGRLQAQRVSGGETGVIFDLRGRPIRLATDQRDRARQLATWFAAMDAYPGYGQGGGQPAHDYDMLLRRLGGGTGGGAANATSGQGGGR